MKIAPLARSAALLTLALPLVAHGAIATWTGAIDGDFTNAGNWLGGIVPGTPGLVPGNTDTALFNNAASTAIALNGDRNLSVLSFDNSAPGLGSFAIGGNTLAITNGGSARVSGMWGTAAQTVASAIQINTAFTVFDDAGNGGISFTGPITNAATTGTATLNLRSGLGTGTIAFTGGLQNNGAGLLAVTIAQSSTGQVTLAGANTFTGALTVTNGRLLVDDTAGAQVLATAMPLTLTGATMEFRGAASGASTESVGTLTVSENSLSRLILNPTAEAA